MPHVVIVGGGITGLAAAYHLAHKSDSKPPRITLIEANNRLGGKIYSKEFAGATIDPGPEAFLAQAPTIKSLCKELGLEEALEAPATNKSYIWTRGRLRSLPEGLVYGVPTRIGPIAFSGILSLPGMARAGLDLLLPRHSLPVDPSIMQVIGSRCGQEVVERLVEPLLGGIHAGRADKLSLESIAPALALAAKRQRSLVAGLRSMRPPKETKPSPVLLGIKGGLAQLIRRLHEALSEVEMLTGTCVVSIVRQPDGRYCVYCEGHPPLIADSILLATPAQTTADMLSEMAPELALGLRSIVYASVVTVILAYTPSALRRPIAGSGFLVPRVDGRLLSACTLSTNKWAHLRASPMTIVRCSSGRYGDTRALDISDDLLVERLHNELVAALGIQQRPVEHLITRWEQALPQYEPGHRERVAEIESTLANWPGLFLAGAPYHGMGIAACVDSATTAATRMQAHLAMVVQAS